MTEIGEKRNAKGETFQEECARLLRQSRETREFNRTIHIDQDDPYAMEKQFLSCELFYLYPGGFITGKKIYEAYTIFSKIHRIPLMKFSTFKVRLKTFFRAEGGNVLNDFLKHRFGKAEYDQMILESRKIGQQFVVQPKIGEGPGSESELIYWRGRYPGNKQGVVIGLGSFSEKWGEFDRMATVKNGIENRRSNQELEERLREIEERERKLDEKHEKDWKFLEEPIFENTLPEIELEKAWGEKAWEGESKKGIFDMTNAEFEESTSGKSLLDIDFEKEVKEHL